MTTQRVVENLNAALHQVLAADSDVYVLGEDIHDPYGGAFKVTRGLTTAFPGRVLTTPIAEAGLVGMAGGLALAGAKAIAEVMFGDFIALAFDPLVNFISKSVSMYGRAVPMHFVLRCPTGGHRGYGPTHSQCLQKHFIGVPNLALHEVSPFHDNRSLLSRLINSGTPSILFEDKSLYAQPMVEHGSYGELLEVCALGGENDWMWVGSRHFRRPSTVIIAHGGMALSCSAAISELFLQYEIEASLLVPSRLYPLAFHAEASAVLRQAERVIIVEESVAGGTWGAELATHLYPLIWGQLKQPIVHLCSKDSIIPSAPHLEKKVLLQTSDLVHAIKGAVYAA